MDVEGATAEPLLNQSVWLPNGVDWEDLKHFRLENIYFRIITFLICSLLVRYFFLNPLIFAPLARWYNIKSNSRKVKDCPKLEEFYRKNKKPSSSDYVALSKQTDIPERSVQAWFRKRRAQDIPSQLIKFQESAWKFTVYSFFFFYGLAVLRNEQWFNDFRYFWIGFPKQFNSEYALNHYGWIMGLYLHFGLTQFFDIKRKDFWPMFIHHWTVLAGMCGAFITGNMRAVSVALVYHDAADPLLELAKMLHYMKLHVVSEISFVGLVVTWTYTRMYIFPLIIYSSLYDSLKYAHAAAYTRNILCGLEIVVMCLHIYWYILILKIAINGLVNQGIHDSRSGSEAEEEEVESNHVTNGTNGDATEESILATAAGEKEEAKVSHNGKHVYIVSDPVVGRICQQNGISGHQNGLPPLGSGSTNSTMIKSGRHTRTLSSVDCTPTNTTGHARSQSNGCIKTRT